MSETVISIENISKYYRLGLIGSSTIRNDLNCWWHRVRGKPDPNQRINECQQNVDNAEGIWAVRNVSLEIEKGEVIGIIGRNGSGKSTLLKLLSRVTAPTEGQIKVKGRIASLLEVGTGFHPELTGRENIFLNGAILGMKKNEIRSKFDEIVAFAEVEKFIDTPVKRYSSGMYVRLAFAVAAHLDPDILIVDEVLAVGDVAFQSKCLGKMSSVASEGRTVLFVSHNMGAIKKLCERVVLLNNGTAVNSGLPGDIISQYVALSKGFDDTPIRDRSDRQGTGSVRITDVKFSVSGVSDVTVIQCGDKVDIMLEYTTESVVNRPIYFLSICDNLGSPLIHLNSRAVDSKVRPIDRGGATVCTIPNFPLAPGQYTINVAIGDGADVLDRLAGAKTFIVESGDFYSSGDTSTLTWASFLVQHTWEIR